MVPWEFKLTWEQVEHQYLKNMNMWPSCTSEAVAQTVHRRHIHLPFSSTCTSEHYIQNSFHPSLHPSLVCNLDVPCISYQKLRFWERPCMQFYVDTNKDANTMQERRTLINTQHAVCTHRNSAKANEHGFKGTLQIRGCQLEWIL